MAKTVFKLQRKAISSRYAGPEMNRAIKARVQRDVFPTVLGELNDYVADWKDKPEFKPYITSGSSKIQFGVRVDVEDDDSAEARWLMVDTEGRKGGAIIEPKKQVHRKNKKTGQIYLDTVRLPMRIYQSKTAGGMGFTGEISKFVRSVVQGSVEPQYYSDSVKRRVAGDLNRIVPGSILYNAIRLGYRTAARKITGSRNR